MIRTEFDQHRSGRSRIQTMISSNPMMSARRRHCPALMAIRPEHLLAVSPPVLRRLSSLTGRRLAGFRTGSRASLGGMAAFHSRSGSTLPGFARDPARSCASLPGHP